MSAWTLAEGINQRPLKGEVALVTGSLGGLGRVITEGLAAAGAAVAVHHLGQREEAELFVEELTLAGVSAMVVEADVTDWDSVGEMMQQIAAQLGPVSVLVNNAGIMRKQSFMDMSLQQWQETIDVDLTGVFIITRQALPGMLAAGRGAIVMVSSQLAYKGAHDYVSYCAAKGGIVGMTHALAREVGPSIRVNAIAPGPITTPMTDEITTPEWVAERTAGAVLQRLGVPAEVVAAVLFLAAPGSELMHGQVLHLNGGGVMS